MLRGQKVILDADLAESYGVTIKRLNQQVNRNAGRFPSDFVFQISAKEDKSLRLQFVTSNPRRDGRRYLPYAFTEHGAIMAAAVLNSGRAVEMSTFVVRAFIRMREALATPSFSRATFPGSTRLPIFRKRERRIFCELKTYRNTIFVQTRQSAGYPSAPWPFTLHLTFRLPFANNSHMAITRRQRQVYDFISDFVQKHSYSPSFEEIGEGLGLSSLATVHKHITNLEKKGLLTRDYNRSRSIDLLPPKGRLKQAMAVNTTMVLPLLGRIAAGQPIEAVENPQTISLADFVRSKEVFVLEVRGESMQDEHILDGDYVLVEKAKTAHNGDIVVALLDGTDATLKRFYREGDKVRLQPSNAAMQPIIVAAAAVQIQGRVIGVLRKY